ncbi:MAG: putative molybdenum carrier protein [Gammaproteobacteria bacterium]|nr:MAG: putative molybdenum carrier protein [Gammaproteobacteria bacterium]
MRLRRIVSGGQTGVDRGALDAALAQGLPCGGWCPAGRRAEDGTIPNRYPLIEMPVSDYPARTRRNVVDSDATLIISSGPPTGGTRLTRDLCRETDRPCLVLRAEALTVDQAAQAAFEFARDSNVRTLNVAGPRASGWPDGQGYARQVLGALIALVQAEDSRNSAVSTDKDVMGGEQVDPRQT